MGETHDVVTIGGGPGGYVAAIRAAQLGLKVALVEREHLGGVCLNWGCIPSKALLRNAEVISLLGRGRRFGFTIDGFQADYGAAVKRSRRVAGRLVKGVAALMNKNAIQVVEGSGSIADARTVEVRSSSGVSTLHAKHIIIATGARARSIPGVEVDGEYVLTARHALAMQDLPASAIIVGAGPIGMEFAHIWGTYGTEITVVEMLPRLLPLEDEDISAEVTRAFKRRKVRALTSTRVLGVTPTAEGVQVRVQAEGGEEETMVAEKVLVAIGVRPNSEGLGLEKVGVELERGWVVVDSLMRTSVSGVFAIGDVTGKLPLAHVASAQGIVAAETIAGAEPHPLDYDAIPRCTYCQPQVASFGLTAAQAQEQGYEVRVGQFPFLPNGKALALDENEGVAKIVVDAATGRLLGGHLVGPEVTELLPELVLARNEDLSVEAIARAVHAHPTLSEVLAEAAHGAFGEPIHL